MRRVNLDELDRLVTDDMRDITLKSSEVRNIIARVRDAESPRLRAYDEWDDDAGDVVWWVVPICEPPSYVGRPYDSDFPDNVTHWTPCPCPRTDGSEL